MPKMTRLRMVRAKKPEALLLWINGLPFKVEMKGMPSQINRKWVLWYVLPEDSGIDLPLILDI